MTAQYKVHGDIAVITLNNPPVNGLGHVTRTALVEGIQNANADKKISAIVITGAGKAFSGGADIKEFGTPKMLAEPSLHTLLNVVESSAKPVVAAIHTTCMGGGLELSLACHYRVAAPGCNVSLPEVKLGLLPGAGGTQRLPRALGVENALNMIISGESVKSELLASMPGQKLFDLISTNEKFLLDEAIEFAQKVAFDRPLPKVRDLPCKHPMGDAYFQFARNMARGMAPQYPAPVKCIDAIAAATKKPFEEGMATERELFINLMWSPESRSLQHLFMADRARTKIDGVDETTPVREIKSIGVIGAGLMGGGIAMNFLNAGIPVVIIETKQEALDKGVATVRGNYEGQVKKGKLKQDKFEQRMALLKPSLSYDDLKDVDLVIEAVFEDMGVKEQVFSKLDSVLKPGAILASNTSTLDLDKIAAFTKRPADVIGLHFFSPANVMKLLEIVRGKETSPEVLATAMAIAKTIRKTAVVSGVCDGFIGNRMVEQYGRQAGFMLDEGATPEQIDKAAEKFGFVMGPFRMSDLAGNDIGQYIRKRKLAADPTIKYSKTADLLCEKGRFGQKTNAGWYDYIPGKRDAIPSQEVVDMIAAHREASGFKARKITDEEIVQRLVYALVNEGAKILEEGIAARASDIDMVYIFGYGFPPYRGGPMHYASEQGLLNVATSMQGFAKNKMDDQAFWTPAPLLAQLAAEGKRFA